MAIYCMSDLHGDIDSYRRMLKLIEFSDDDQLYILGDVVDRHPHGVEILLDIMDRPNIHMLWGNHEDMMYRGVVFHDREFWSMWIMNGGGVTRKGLFYRETAKNRERILAYLRNLSLFYEIEVNGRKFFLVHASAGKDVYDYIWWRPEDGPAPLNEDATVVVGHTPTYHFRDDGNPFTIYSEPGIYYIDCGCGSQHELRQLGCLRLDDLREFYIRCVETTVDNGNG